MITEGKTLTLKNVPNLRSLTPLYHVIHEHEVWDLGKSVAFNGFIWSACMVKNLLVECLKDSFLVIVLNLLTFLISTWVFGWLKNWGMVSAAPGNDWPMNSSSSFFLLWVMAALSRPICFDISDDFSSLIAKSQRVRNCSSCRVISSSISPGLKFSMF